MSQDENVLVFPAKALQDLGSPQGFLPAPEYYNKIFLPEDKFSFMPRSLVEKDESFKQVCTYCVIHYNEKMHHDTFVYIPMKESSEVFSYFRGKCGGESRLVAKRSLGIGGHVSGERDPRYSMPAHVMTNAKREISEEVILNISKPILVQIGYINDDSDYVGRVHFGVVYDLRVDDPVVLPAELCVRDGQMRTVADIKATRDEYESWSQILIDNLL